MRAIKVLKFGGASMNTPETIERVVAIIKKSRKESRVPAIVVSAMRGVTDQLIHIAEMASHKRGSYKTLLQNIEKRHADAIKSLLGKRVQTSSLKDMEATFSELAHDLQEVSSVGAPSGGARDKITSYGERLSARLLADVLNARNVPSEYLDMRSVIVTDDNFGAAAVDFGKTNGNIRKNFSAGGGSASGGQLREKLQIATGFIGATKDHETTTIGRGGSDYTACILGAALGAKVIEIWAGVDGVMTADPQQVKDARSIRTMSYEEAAEISYFGAKVIQD